MTETLSYKDVKINESLIGAHIDLTTSSLALHFLDNVTLTVQFDRNSKVGDNFIDLRNGKVDKIELIPIT